MMLCQARNIKVIFQRNCISVSLKNVYYYSNFQLNVFEIKFGYVFCSLKPNGGGGIYTVGMQNVGKIESFLCQINRFMFFDFIQYEQNEIFHS